MTKKQHSTRSKERLAPDTAVCINAGLASLYKKFFVKLLLRCGISKDGTLPPRLDLGSPIPRPYTPPLPPPPPKSLRARKVLLRRMGSMLYSSLALKPSSSRSRRNAFSFSSRSSRSARLAWSWFVESEDCNSSMVARRRSILSRDFEMSSLSCTLALSRRSI